MSDENKTISTSIATKEKIEVQKPKLYKVILLNDDYTPMEYVVKLLRVVFKKSEFSLFLKQLTTLNIVLKRVNNWYV